MASDVEVLRGMLAGAFAESTKRALSAAISALESRERCLLPPDEEVGLPRYGLRWAGPGAPVAERMEDGHWTPHHLAVRERDSYKARVEALEVAIREVDRLLEVRQDRCFHSRAREVIFDALATPPPARASAPIPEHHDDGGPDDGDEP